MTKRKRIFDDLKEGLDEALAFARGKDGDFKVHIPPEIDVRGMRRRLKLTQEEFAAQFGFSVARVRDWEQGRTHPDAALRAYLLVIQRKPKAVMQALAVA